MKGIVHRTYGNIARVPIGMKVSRGRIVSATEDALFEYYRINDYGAVMPFPRFREYCRCAGVEIR